MISNNEIKQVFKAEIENCIYDSEDFRVYSCKVDIDKYPDIKLNKYNNVSINGELPKLTTGAVYNITGIEKTSKYGVGYKVFNIRRDIPAGSEGTNIFLHEILTEKQADVLFEHYPDIIQRVKENRLNDIDLKKLKGIGNYTFDCIVDKINENFVLADLVIEFRGYLNLSIIKKLYNRYSSVEKLKQKLAKDPYKCLCDISGIGFKMADYILLEIEKVSKKDVEDGKEPIINFECDLRTSKQRCKACVEFLLSENEKEGHTKTNLVDLRKECLAKVPECADYFTEVIKEKDFFYDKETLFIALSRTYNLEKYIATQIYENVKNDNVWDIDINKYNIVDGFELTDEQMKTLNSVCEYNVSVLTAPAGSGKTSSMIAVIKMLKDNRKSFSLFAPTGKASKVLAECTKEKASTIHRGLMYNPMKYTRTDSNGHEYKTFWGYDRNEKLDVDIVIIDEFSMVDVDLFYHLIDAIDLTKTKLLLIGDAAQLPSVGCGNLLYDFTKSDWLIPIIKLTKIFRYADGGLMKVATDIRQCKNCYDSSMKNKLTKFGEDYFFLDTPKENTIRCLVALYKKLLNKGYSSSDIQIITAKNIGDYGTTALNNVIQKIANPNSKSDISMSYGETIYYEGDIVIQKVNNYKAELDLSHLSYEERDKAEIIGTVPTAFVANGESGTIIEIGFDYVLIDFDGIVVSYKKDQLKMIKLGYVITYHASQGSGFKIVILLSTKSDIFMLNSNLLYTGLTRMKEFCYHIGSLQSVVCAIKKKANLERDTFMKELLLECKNF